MSTATNVSEKVITSVIDHQFAAMLENMATSNSLEISGFGKLLFHKRKAPKTMLTHLFLQKKVKESLPGLAPDARKRAEIKLSNLEMEIKALNQKLQSYENQFCTNLGGVAQPADTSSRNETAHSRSGRRKNSNM